MFGHYEILRDAVQKIFGGDSGGKVFEKGIAWISEMPLFVADSKTIIGFNGSFLVVLFISEPILLNTQTENITQVAEYPIHNLCSTVEDFRNKIARLKRLLSGVHSTKMELLKDFRFQIRVSLFVAGPENFLDTLRGICTAVLN